MYAHRKLTSKISMLKAKELDLAEKYENVELIVCTAHAYKVMQTIQKRYNVSYLALYATEADTKDYKLINCIQLWGLVYTVTQFFYFKGYSSGDPKGRLPIGGFNGLEEAKINYDPN
ncbi:unnamed protein product [Lactuca saligna]|uniref:Uncharacterized protein n=1 Tax=Lactuca saligna TaxID=75948 RepID=A0AA36ELE9_LACSI|nr:unnamed protein product [Lactuca saligna]